MKMLLLCGFSNGIILISLVFFRSIVYADTEILYPRADSLDDRQNHPIQVLELALSKVAVDFNIVPSSGTMTQARALTELMLGKRINIVWSMTSIDRENDFTPIRIPLDKGLLGWRMLLIRKGSSTEFARIEDLSDLERFSSGQGHDWPDTKILRHNGLHVEGSTHYPGLFLMLAHGRFDFFPRSVLEIWDEFESHKSLNLEIEKTLVLQYPTAQYFFLNKNDKVLADKISRGLKIAIDDGSFEALFMKNYGDIIERSNISNRTKLILKNPLLPPLTPLGDKNLWLTF
jgi:hypothetical protein